MFYNFINTHNQNWPKLHQTVDNFLRILYQYILFAWISEKIMMYSTFLCANDSVDQCNYWRVIFTIIRRTKLQSLSYDHWGSTSMQRVPIELLALWLWHTMRYINIFINTYTHIHMYIHLQFYIISYITLPELIDHTISTIFFNDMYLTYWCTLYSANWWNIIIMLMITPLPRLFCICQ